MGLRVWYSIDNGKFLWCPEYGNIPQPSGWELLRPGNTYMTRTLKKLGLHWILLQRHKKYTYNIGIIAPAENIKEVRKLEEESQ